MIAKLEGRGQNYLSNFRAHKSGDEVVVKDPIIVRSKGDLNKAGKRKKCSKCKSSGQNIRSYKKGIRELTNDEIFLSLDSSEDEVTIGVASTAKVGDMFYGNVL